MGVVFAVGDDVRRLQKLGRYVNGVVVYRRFRFQLVI